MLLAFTLLVVALYAGPSRLLAFLARLSEGLSQLWN
jgi:hypothetical protein